MLCAGIDCERILEHRCRTGVVATRERGLAEADEHGGHLRRQLARALEERLGLFRLTLIEVAPAQPNQRRDVIRRYFERLD